MIFQMCLCRVFFLLLGLEYAVDTSKSFIIGMALLENHINVEKAAYLSRLELEFQVIKKNIVYYSSH